MVGGQRIRGPQLLHDDEAEAVCEGVAFIGMAQKEGFSIAESRLIRPAYDKRGVGVDDAPQRLQEMHDPACLQQCVCLGKYVIGSDKGTTRGLDVLQDRNREMVQLLVWIND